MPSESSDKAPPARRNRRRFSSHLIHGDVRLRLVADDVLFALFASLTAIGILYYLSNKEIGDSLWSAHQSIKQTRELLNTGVITAGIVTFVAVLVFGLWSLVDAHRIAGPMHRLCRLLNEIADGNLTHEIRFRKTDEFQELAAAADRLVDCYAERISRLRSSVAIINGVMQTEALKPEEHSAVRNLVEDMTRELAFFELPAENEHPAIDDRPIQ